MPDADALSRSYAEGARAGRKELLRDLEELRDEWSKGGESYDEMPVATAAETLTAIIAKHTKEYPSGPDLREAAMEALNALLDYVPTLEKQGGSMNYGRRVIKMLQVALTDHTEAGEWRCAKCGMSGTDELYRQEHRMLCTGERRKGG